MKRPFQLVFTGALFAWMACTSEPPSPRVVRVTIYDDGARSLAGVAIEIDGVTATKSGADGSANISLAPRGPGRARIRVGCPASMRPAEPRYVPRVAKGSTAKLELAFVCRPKLRKLLVVARAPGAEGLTLRADGEPVGQVGADGTLHALIERAPGSDVRLLLDTGERQLSPVRPTRELHVGDHDEIFVFDQPFAPARTRVRKPVVSRPPPEQPKVSLPYAIR